MGELPGKYHTSRSQGMVFITVDSGIRSGGKNKGAVLLPRNLAVAWTNILTISPSKEKSAMMLTGLSGNEIYCLAQKGWAPRNIVVGNSVYSLGVIGGFASGLRTLAGGEVENVTQLISDGRHAAIQRLEREAEGHAAHGLTGVVSELKTVGGLTEFLAIGSA